MASTFISSSAISTTLRIAAMKSQAAVSRATKEATTGRHADVGLSLGALAGRDVVLRAERVEIDKLVDTNALVAGRLDTSQQRISGLIDTAESFQKDLLAARNSANGGTVIAQSAAANLKSLISTLNVAMNGQYLFAGTNTGVTPMVDYAAGSPSKTAIDAAFVATFGFSQSSPLVSGISAVDMQSFLDTTLQAEFDDPAWGANWSTSSDQVMRSRISTTQTIDSSATANEPAFRKLAMAYTMLSDLGTQNLNQAALQSVIDTAIGTVGEAINDLAGIGAHLGTAQEQTTNATSRLKVQGDLITQQVTAMEEVDPAEASVRVTNLNNQLEMSLALTARIQQLSILNYL
ncbi:flagellar hook-associated family protein [Rhodopseudomonas sp. NSM]|uniref:flagellar hook-associated family protein n=1 Tax=Rhodopseudomonas sp. NSM TaxID=3457630 RepID=UPI0040353DBF